MRKIFCDRCGKEIKNSEAWQIDAQYVLQLKDKNGVFSKRDLCLSCLNDLRQWSASSPESPTAALKLDTWYSSKDYALIFENNEDNKSEDFMIVTRGKKKDA